MKGHGIAAISSTSTIQLKCCMKVITKVHKQKRIVNEVINAKSTDVGKYMPWRQSNSTKSIILERGMYINLDSFFFFSIVLNHFIESVNKHKYSNRFCFHTIYDFLWFGWNETHKRHLLIHIRTQTSRWFISVALTMPCHKRMP